MPRIRDFRGVSPRGFDGRGNYSMGVREQIIFPEIQYDADRSAARHGYHDHDHGARQQAGPGTAGSIQLPVPQVSRDRRVQGQVWPRPTWFSARSDAPGGEEVCGQARAAEGNHPQSEVHAGAARWRRRSALQQQPRDASHEPPAQPLCDHRPLARGVPQVRAGAHARSARSRCAVRFQDSARRAGRSCKR